MTKSSQKLWVRVIPSYARQRDEIARKDCAQDQSHLRKEYAKDCLHHTKRRNKSQGKWRIFPLDRWESLIFTTKNRLFLDSEGITVHTVGLLQKRINWSSSSPAQAAEIGQSDSMPEYSARLRRPEIRAIQACSLLKWVDRHTRHLGNLGRLDCVDWPSSLIGSYFKGSLMAVVLTLLSIISFQVRGGFKGIWILQPLVSASIQISSAPLFFNGLHPLHQLAADGGTGREAAAGRIFLR